MKQSYKIFLTTLLVIVFVFTFGMISVQAESAEGHKLSFTSDTVGYHKIYLAIDGGEKQEIVVGETYNIPKSAGIEVWIELMDGYALTGLFHNGDNLITNAGDTKYSTPSLTSDAVFQVVCAPRQYHLYYNGAAEDGYQVIGGPKTHTFGTDTVLESPVKSGYSFLHWEIGTDKNAKPGEGVKLLKRESDGKTVLGASVSAKMGDTIYLVPVFAPNQYPVRCEDFVFDPNFSGGRGAPLGFTEWMADMDSLISGKDIPDPQTYIGYYFDGSDSKYYTTWTVKVDDKGEKINVVTRLYLPIRYQLEYGVQLGDGAPDFSGALDFADGVVAPMEHVYNANTHIPNPVRVGYRFDAWIVQIYQNGTWVTVEDKHLGKTSEGLLQLPKETVALASEQSEGTYAIRLIAKMLPRSFSVIYDWNDAPNDAVDFEESLYDTYVYDSILQIPNPVYPGYRFEGWTLSCEGVVKTIDSADGMTLIEGPYLGDITLKARWSVKHFEVVLDGNGADTGYEGELLGAIYDQTFSPSHIAIPTREGYRFLGFYTDSTTEGLTPWIDGNGNPTNQIWKLDSDELLENGTYRVTLYARWEIQTFLVTIIPFEPALDFVEILLNDEKYEGGKLFVYGDTVNITVKIFDKEYKLTRFNGETTSSPEETAEGYVYTISYQVGTKNELQLTVLPMIDASGVKIHYANETLILPTGVYRLYCDNVIYSVIVNEDGKYFIAKGGQAAVEADRFAIPENFFGKTLTVRMWGIEHVSADRECVFELPTRAPAPEKGNGAGDWIVDIMPSLNTIKITMAQMTQGYFEYACVLRGSDDKALNWMALDTDENGVLTILGLAYGTDYDIYIRVKAVEDDVINGISGAPHGIAFGPQYVRTSPDQYIEGICAELDAMRTGDDEKMVDRLIDATQAEIRAIDPAHPTVQTLVEQILERFRVDYQLAEKQDYMIGLLLAKHAEFVASNAFDGVGITALNTILEDTLEKIRAVSESTELTELQAQLDQIDLLFREALRQMETVPISYLYYKNHKLSVNFGLPQGSAWSIFMSDHETIAEAIENAIRTGNVVMDGKGIDRDALSTMVVRAYYGMTLELPHNAQPERGVYEFRIFLPDELRMSTLGMQAAYYNESTGELVVLDTRRDGDYLVFESTRSSVGNFVILCDEEIDLTGFIIGLSLTLLAQLIAIVYLFRRRSKFTGAKRHYSVALPATLAIHFLPASSFTIVVILAILVIIAQIFLTALLLSTNVTYRYKDGSIPEETTRATGKRRRRARAVPPSEEATMDVSGYEPLEETDYGEHAPLLADLTEEETTVSVESETAFEETEEMPDLSQSDEDDQTVQTFAQDSMQIYEDARTVDEIFTEEDPFGFMVSDSQTVYETEEADVNASADFAEESYVEDDEAVLADVASLYGEEEIFGFAEDDESADQTDLDDGCAIEKEAAPADIFAVEDAYEPEMSDELEEVETIESATWEPDELAPDPEEEILYEDDYITGEPSEPVPYEDDISGDPNPYEADDDRR